MTCHRHLAPRWCWKRCPQLLGTGFAVCSDIPDVCRRTGLVQRTLSLPTEVKSLLSAGLGCRPLSSSSCSIFLVVNLLGGAGHGISQVGTGAFATGVAFAAAPPRGARASREGDWEIEGKSGGLSANATGSLHRCSRTIALSNPIRGEGKDPPRSPQSLRLGRARGRGRTNGDRRGGPTLERKASLRVDRAGEPAWRAWVIAQLLARRDLCY